MLAKAHITIGMAAALTAVRPETVPEALPVIAGAAAGCLICDIDCDIAAEKADTSAWRLGMAAVFVCVLIEDYLMGAGMWETLLSRNSHNMFMSFCMALPEWIPFPVEVMLVGFVRRLAPYISWLWPHLWFFGVAGFALACTFAGISKHRGFSHSLLAMLIETACIWMVFPSVCVPFMIAFLTHIVLDVMNKKPVCVFYPVKKGICLGWFYADRTADKVFTALGTAWLAAISLLCVRR